MKKTVEIESYEKMQLELAAMNEKDLCKKEIEKPKPVCMIPIDDEIEIPLYSKKEHQAYMNARYNYV